MVRHGIVGKSLKAMRVLHPPHVLPISRIVSCASELFFIVRPRVRLLRKHKDFWAAEHVVRSLRRACDTA